MNMSSLLWCGAAVSYEHKYLLGILCPAGMAKHQVEFALREGETRRCPRMHGKGNGPGPLFEHACQALATGNESHCALARVSGLENLAGLLDYVKLRRNLRHSEP